MFHVQGHTHKPKQILSFYSLPSEMGHGGWVPEIKQTGLQAKDFLIVQFIVFRLKEPRKDLKTLNYLNFIHAVVNQVNSIVFPNLCIQFLLLACRSVTVMSVLSCAINTFCAFPLMEVSNTTHWQYGIFLSIIYSYHLQNITHVISYLEGNIKIM